MESYPRLELSHRNILYNLTHFRSMLKPNVKMLVLLKANAYGHGAEILGRVCEDAGVDYIGVAFANEGIALRRSGVRLPIMVLTPGTECFKEMVDYHLEPGLPDIQAVRLFDEYIASRGMKDYPCHIKIDSGMHRVGFMEQDLQELVAFLKAGTVLRIESLYSHLAAADDPSLDRFTFEQAALFNKISEQIISTLGYRPMRHLLNSSGIERFAGRCPDMQYDMVRLGIGFYGLQVLPDQDIRPIAALRTRICQVKQLEDGTVGYSRRGIIRRQSVIATIPLGYADGLNRHLGCGRAKFLLRGKLVPTIGNICMDACMLDVTGVDAREGDIVTVFGLRPRAEELAEILDTIPYEIITSVSQRVNRVLVEDID